VVIPAAFVRYGGLAVDEHWKIYLPVVLGSFVLMVPPLVQAERRGRMKFLFLSAIALLLAAELGFAVCLTNFGMAVALLVAFFVAFNVLEASLPSLVSRVAPAASRGTALGVYNTTQALGLRSEEHTSELQSRVDLVCRLLLEKKKLRTTSTHPTAVRTYRLCETC